MRIRTHVTMNVYWFGLSFMWNALHPIVLPALLLNFVPEALKNTYLGVMTFIGLILAMIIQPLSGALSDSIHTRWGRRRPWMLGGVLLDLAILTGMALVGGFPGLLAAYLLLQFASNCAHGPAQGLIPDLVPEEQRGLASGVKNLFDMLGLVVASLVAGQLMGDGNAVLAFFVIGAVLAASAAVTLLTTKEQRGPGAASETPGFRTIFRADLRRYPDYARLLVSRLLILLGIYAVQSFAQYFIRDVLAAPNPAEVTGNLLAAIGLPLTLLVFPAGLLSDRFGRRRLNLLAGAVITLGIFLLTFAHDVTAVLVFGALIGIGTGIFVSVNWAWATDLIPQHEAGKYLGLSNLATAGASAAARLGGPLIDGINALRPGAYLGYPVLFLISAAVVLVGTLLVLRVRETAAAACPPESPRR
ncbi:MAG: MFS transporter [Anaerolineae bacterium]|nr:MFS transporter [Anaerolineae bacterium]